MEMSKGVSLLRNAQSLLTGRTVYLVNIWVEIIFVWGATISILHPDILYVFSCSMPGSMFPNIVPFSTRIWHLFPCFSVEALPGVLGNRGTSQFISGEQGNNGQILRGTGEQRQYWGTGNIRKQIFDFWGTGEQANLFQGNLLSIAIYMGPIWAPIWDPYGQCNRVPYGSHMGWPM